MGVWIETYQFRAVRWYAVSHPSWVCGLKPPVTIFLNSVNKVTPFVGVWIETRCFIVEVNGVQVTPFVGVWIETASGNVGSGASASHTLRGCVD